MKHFVLLALLCSMTTSCGLFFRQKVTIAENTTNNRYIGRIASLPGNKKFALIEIYKGKRFETGTILISYGENRQANLKLTGEKLSRYAAADIQSGTLEIGDAVYSNPAAPLIELPPAQPKRETAQPSLF